MPSAITISARDAESAICSVKSSVQTVFAIPELLELILLQLPFLDLVRAQMINQSFIDVIESSNLLQRALFFRASPDTSFPRPNPLLQPCHNAQFLDLRSTQTRCRYLHNPRGRRMADWSKWPVIDYRDGFKLNIQPTNEAVRRKEASWRRMLIVQPPVEELEMNGPPSRKIVDRFGVTMDELGSPLGKLRCVDFEIFTSGKSRMIVEKQMKRMAH
ncbi:putative f-box domain protein [Botrytis fragariae]|uniref:Putative f-box domain protein n=1 Tax=Botrytis fragariae TaxID=1964551 RepID=A0A8H6B148_9HELO|nr:putative f-box domain protein [Botrytis fragariae]KAF5877240.1 putative f-box domain protein [Botrytis fragariae]